MLPISATIPGRTVCNSGFPPVKQKTTGFQAPQRLPLHGSLLICINAVAAHTNGLVTGTVGVMRLQIKGSGFSGCEFLLFGG